MSDNSLGVLEQSDEQKTARRKASVEGMMVEKRDGRAVPFDPVKVEYAIENAAIAAGKSQKYVKESINGTVDRIIDDIIQRFQHNDFCPNVENIHDVVEKHLMIGNHYEVAKAYILFRADRRRTEQEQRKKVTFLKKLTVQKTNGSKVLFNPQKVKATLERHSKGLKLDQEIVFEEAVKNIYSGIKSEEIERALILAATSFIEIEPDYNVLSSRLFLQKLKKEVFGHSGKDAKDAEDDYRQSFIDSIRVGVEAGTLDARMLDYDLESLSQKLNLNRDNLFKYIGLSTLYERYFTQFDGRRLEMPQTFFMRVAMGLALDEDKKEKWAVKFYDVMSEMFYMPSTPTLFHAGLSHPQLSSCYLTTVDDNLENIFQAFNDNAQLSKWSGGLGNDWTPVRSTGAAIKSTGVESQGVVPFQHIANATTIAISRSGKRRGATCAYLEVWHSDIFDFIDLRRNTGDFRRRTHDMNIAAWIPDLFMERVEKNEKWTLFSPDETPDLHELYGEDFRKAYTAYERKAKRGKINKFQTIDAVHLYRKIIERLFETGHPWLTWKDACNIRSPQDHAGVIHSSNLCTEITLNTSPSELISDEYKDGIRKREFRLGEVAVCNLGSVVLPNHITKTGKIDKERLHRTVTLAMRMLDNVVGLNFYPIPEAENSNFKHRPVGLGIMGLQDALFKADVNYEDSGDFGDELQELISYNAISASSDLAKERGAYASFEGSKWQRGIFPLDTISLLEDQRGEKIDVSRNSRLDWKSLKKKVQDQGMRNSNTMAIAPTATISGVVGCLGPCGEPLFKNIFVKANMTGEFTIVNEYLIEDLKKLKLWSRDMLDQIKFHDGSIQSIEAIPQNLKDKYKEAFEIDPFRAVDLTALRGKWIDQSQSHNVFIRGKSGKLLSELYMYAWKKGLKTTYYLRSLGASQIEKSTLDANKFGFTQKRDGSSNGQVKACALNDPDCEACQ